MDICHNEDSFKLILNDFSTYVFAEAILSKKQLNTTRESLVFPLLLELRGNVAINYYRVTQDGILQLISPIPINEYLYEQVTKISNETIEIAFVFWKSGSPGEAILVIVSANRITIKENQDRAWLQLFGNEFDDYYNYFKSQFNADRYVSDYQECLDIIEELDFSRN